MNRAWVWGKRGKSHWKKEVLPFWVFTGAGLVLSTIAIHFAQDHTDNRSPSCSCSCAPSACCGSLRFFVLDRLFHVEVFEDDTPDEL